MEVELKTHKMMLVDLEKGWVVVCLLKNSQVRSDYLAAIW